ncbi:hypothetical protein OH77DRAFT_1428955 [Trametes cingulata]|nr:hypothetical protein OH77DRAFT_1428955 [Trametes cingulata]
MPSPSPAPRTLLRFRRNSQGSWVAPTQTAPPHAASPTNDVQQEAVLPTGQHEALAEAAERNARDVEMRLEGATPESATAAAVATPATPPRLTAEEKGKGKGPSGPPSGPPTPIGYSPAPSPSLSLEEFIQNATTAEPPQPDLETELMFASTQPRSPSEIATPPPLPSPTPDEEDHDDEMAPRGRKRARTTSPIPPRLGRPILRARGRLGLRPSNPPRATLPHSSSLANLRGRNTPDVNTTPGAYTPETMTELAASIAESTHPGEPIPPPPNSPSARQTNDDDYWAHVQEVTMEDLADLPEKRASAARATKLREWVRRTAHTRPVADNSIARKQSLAGLHFQKITATPTRPTQGQPVTTEPLNPGPSSHTPSLSQNPSQPSHSARPHPNVSYSQPNAPPRATPARVNLHEMLKQASTAAQPPQGASNAHPEATPTPRIPAAADPPPAPFTPLTNHAQTAQNTNYIFTPVPANGFPSTTFGTPNALLQGLAPSRQALLFAQPDGTIVLIQIYNISSPSTSQVQPLTATLTTAVREATGEADPLVVPPEAEWSTRQQRNTNPNTWAVLGLATRSVRRLLARRVWSSPAITFLAYPRDLPIPRYLFTLGGFSHNYRSDILQTIWNTFNGESILPAIVHLVQSHPSYEMITPELAASVLLDTLEITITRSQGGSYSAAVYIDSPTDSPQRWLDWRNHIARLPFQSAINTTGHRKPSPLRDVHCADIRLPNCSPLVFVLYADCSQSGFSREVSTIRSR